MSTTVELPPNTQAVIEALGCIETAVNLLADAMRDLSAQQADTNAKLQTIIGLLAAPGDRRVVIAFDPPPSPARPR